MSEHRYKVDRWYVGDKPPIGYAATPETAFWIARQHVATNDEPVTVCDTEPECGQPMQWVFEPIEWRVVMTLDAVEA